MAMGTGVSGGRVIGQTARHVGDKKGPSAFPVKEVGGELVVTTTDDPEGFMLRPPHLHDALRQLAGIRDHTVSQKFYLDDQGAQPLPIL